MIQSAMRMRLAKIYFRREKRFIDAAAIDIQKTWRRCVAGLSL